MRRLVRLMLATPRVIKRTRKATRLLFLVSRLIGVLILMKLRMRSIVMIVLRPRKRLGRPRLVVRLFGSSRMTLVKLQWSFVYRWMVPRILRMSFCLTLRISRSVVRRVRIFMMIVSRTRVPRILRTRVLIRLLARLLRRRMSIRRSVVTTTSRVRLLIRLSLVRVLWSILRVFIVWTRSLFMRKLSRRTRVRRLMLIMVVVIVLFLLFARRFFWELTFIWLP